MRKLLMMFMCLTILTGCSQPNNDNKETTNQATNQVEDWYTRFETEMENKNLKYTSKSSLDASVIGGKEGYRYVTENGNIDIYRFEDSDELNKILKEKKVQIDNQEKNVEINDHYVIVSDGLSQDVLDVFRNLK